jgi:hypothetical protein
MCATRVVGQPIQAADPFSGGSSRLKAAQRAPRRQDCLPHTGFGGIACLTR